jgi:hypothetical protein
VLTSIGGGLQDQVEHQEVLDQVEHQEVLDQVEHQEVLDQVEHQDLSGENASSSGLTGANGSSGSAWKCRIIKV